jgi:transcriptional regulator with XRE-family HTH domain
MSALGERIQQLRNARGWSRNKLAREAKVSQGYISDLESGKKDAPSGLVLAKLAAALNTSTDYLLGLSVYTSAESHIHKYPVTNLPFTKVGWQTAALLDCLEHEQQNAVVNLVYNLARPKLIQLHPWLESLPNDLQESVLPLLAAGWLHRYIYADYSTFKNWDPDQLQELCNSMLTDYQRIWSAESTPE